MLVSFVNYHVRSTSLTDTLVERLILTNGGDIVLLRERLSMLPGTYQSHHEPLP